jgi:hypothetical protein
MVDIIFQSNFLRDPINHFSPLIVLRVRVEDTALCTYEAQEEELLPECQEPAAYLIYG